MVPPLLLLTQDTGLNWLIHELKVYKVSVVKPFVAY